MTHRHIGPIYAAIFAICQDIVDESSSWNSKSASQERSLRLAVILHNIVLLLFPSCRPTTNWVAGMPDYLPTPCRPVHHLARFQCGRPTFPRIVGLHVSILFSVVPSSFSLAPLFLFPGISVLNTSPVCVLRLSSSHALTSSTFSQ